MNVEELLEMMEETLEAGTIVPFSASKRMVDVDRMRDIIDEVRNNLPDEIRESKKIVNDREQIMQNARIESESIIQQAEERARVLTSEQEIVKRSQQHAAEILSAAQKSAKELTRKATLYCETILKNSEEVLGRSMADIKNTRMNLRSVARPRIICPSKKCRGVVIHGTFLPMAAQYVKNNAAPCNMVRRFSLPGGRNFAACAFAANC